MCAQRVILIDPDRGNAITGMRDDIQTVAEMKVAWSPQRHLLAVEAVDGGVYVFDLPYGLVVNVSQSDSEKAASSWSPDGTQLAYMTYDSTLHRVDFASYASDTIPLMDNGFFEAFLGWLPPSDAVLLEFTPDGVRSDLYRVDIRSKTWEYLARFPEGAVEHVLSANGERIAYVWNNQLYVMDVDSLTSEQLTDDVSYKASPRWVLDDTAIAYRADGIQIIDVTTRRRTQLPTVPTGFGYAVSPDQSRLAFARAGQLCLVDLQPYSEQCTTIADNLGYDLAWGSS
jgi:Tol biopolymer transport system component